MYLGWEPRMYNAPVKNEEAFIPIAFHVTSTLIITTCSPPPQRNLNTRFGLSAV